MNAVTGYIILDLWMK